jgi:hypothetical protein
MQAKWGASPRKFYFSLSEVPFSTFSGENKKEIL